MKCTFIAALYAIKFSEDLSNGDKISDTMRITNNKEALNKILTHEFESIIGRLEANTLRNCGAYIYSHNEIPKETNLRDYLTGQMYCVQEFLMSTWLIKNNTSNFEICFLIVRNNNEDCVTSNFLSHSYCGINGEIKEIILTREELRTARKLHMERIGIKEQQIPIPDNQFKSDSSRISRALTWINSARSHFDNSIRVAHFCTAFETLFSTSNNEISHQLSERMAIFLSSDKEERINIYQNIKRAYELRSRIVHGSTFSTSPNKAPALIAEQCEDLARNAIKKILENDDVFKIFTKSTEDLNKYFLNAIF